MSTYLYRCPSCHIETERMFVPIAERDRQECAICRVPLARIFQPTQVIQIPKNLHTSFSDVHGAYGTPQREQFERDVKEGKIVYDGPGSRWI